MESNPGPSMYRAEALPLGRVEHTSWFVEISLLKPLSLIKREFKDSFQKNDSSFDSETQRKCISSHLHVESESSTV